MSPGERQTEILQFLFKRPDKTATKREIVTNIRGYYRNGDKYVQEVLTRMINNGKITRVKRGVYRLRTIEGKPQDLVQDPAQLDLFGSMEKKPILLDGSLEWQPIFNRDNIA